jgi:hypothetical protein
LCGVWAESVSGADAAIHPAASKSKVIRLLSLIDAVSSADTFASISNEHKAEPLLERE